jgi:hypothetical protein
MRRHHLFDVVICLVAKTHNVAQFVRIVARFEALHQDGLPDLSLATTLQHHGLEFLLLHLGHLVHQTFYHLFHNELLYQQCPKGDQVFVQKLQTLEQSHGNIFISYGCLQESELIRKCLDLGDVV